MKKLIVFLIFTISLCWSMSSCKKDPAAIADNTLTEIVENMKIPANNSNGLTDIRYKNKVLTYRYKIQGSKLENINIDALKRKAYNSLTNNYGNQKLVSTVINANAAIKYVYYNDTDSIVFTFTTNDLKSINP